MSALFEKHSKQQNTLVKCERSCNDDMGMNYAIIFHRVRTLLAG